MLRTVSIASRVATRAASKSAASLQLRASSLVLKQQCACFHATTAAAAVKKNAPAVQEAEEEGEEGEEGQRELVPFPEARSRLVAGLAKETESFDLSEDYATSYAQDNGVTVNVDLPSESVVATRETEGHKIQITFRAEALDTQEDAENENEEDESKLPEHRFHVDVTAPSGKILRLECYNSDKGELEVANIHFPKSATPNPASTPRLTELEEAEQARSGLRVEELSEEASQALFDYLESLGVDDDLAVFVSSQAQHVRTQAMIARISQLKDFAQ